jgi:hypothetical protein
MKRIGFAFILSFLMSASAFCQTRPTWPDIRLAGCPKIVPPKSINERTWKNGEGEQNDAHAVTKVQDRRQAAELLITFAN